MDTLLRALAQHAQTTLVASDTLPHRLQGFETLPYRVLPVRSYGTLASTIISPGLLGTVQREFEAGRANLLHVHSPNPWGDLAILRSAAATPTVMTWHSDIVRQRLLLRMYGGIQQRALARVDRIVVFTPAHYESSEQLHLRDLSRKVVHVPIGIDFDRIDRPERDQALQGRLDRWSGGRPMLLTVGRHVYYKGYQHLLRALKQTRCDSVLVMIGAGPLSAALERQVADLALQDRVLMMGEVDSKAVVTALHRCNVFCQPSIEPSEAFGIAAAEAMACGKPTVVCELHNGVTILNQAGSTSLVVPPRDEPALADALDTLVGDALMRERMGAAAREWVRARFSVQAMQDSTLALYRSLL